MWEEINRSTKEVAHAEVAARMLEVESRFAAIKTSVQEQLDNTPKKMNECMQNLDRSQQSSWPSIATVSSPLVKIHRETVSPAQLMAELIAEKPKSSLEDTLHVLPVSAQDVHANDMVNACPESTPVVEAVHTNTVGLSTLLSGADNGQASYVEPGVTTGDNTEMAHVTSKTECGGPGGMHISDLSVPGGRSSDVAVKALKDDGGQKERSFIGVSAAKIVDRYSDTECSEKDGASFLPDPLQSKRNTTETPRRMWGATGTTPQYPTSKENGSSSLEQRPMGKQRWEGLPDKSVPTNSKISASAGVSSPTKERKEENKSSRKDKKEETLSQYASEDGGSRKLGSSMSGSSSMRTLELARSQKEDITPPRKRQASLTPPLGDGRSGSPTRGACRTLDRLRRETSTSERHEDQPTFLKAPSALIGNVGRHQHQMGGQMHTKTETSLLVAPRWR